MAASDSTPEGRFLEWLLGPTPDPNIQHEFKDVGRFFNPECRALWRKGIRWIRSRPTGFGVVSWEPFFVGLLLDDKAFSARCLQAALNKKRMLRRLESVAHYGGDGMPSASSFFDLEGVKQDLVQYESVPPPHHFWPHIILKGHQEKLQFGPEDTLGIIAEYISAVSSWEWDEEGRRYLDHPGILEPEGLLGDAIIGETIGSSAAFSSVIRSILKQHSCDVSVAIAFRRGKYAVIPQSRFGTHLIGRKSDATLSAVEAHFVNHVRLVEAGSLHEFEELLNSGSLTERAIQDFLEAYPSFLSFGRSVAISSHPALVFSDDRRRIPDFLLERDDGFADILDLKQPGRPIVVGSSHRRRISGYVYDAIAQLKEYARYFDTPANRERVSATTGLRVLTPNLIVVIGRTPTTLSQDEVRVATESLSRDVRILSYDDVLRSARARSVLVSRDAAQRIQRR